MEDFPTTRPIKLPPPPVLQQQQQWNNAPKQQKSGTKQATAVQMALMAKLKFPGQSNKKTAADKKLKKVVAGTPPTEPTETTTNRKFPGTCPGPPPAKLREYAFPGLCPGPPPGGSKFPGVPPGPPPGSKLLCFPGVPPGPPPGFEKRKKTLAPASDPILQKYFVQPPPGRVAKKLAWGVLNENKVKGTVWEQLILADLTLPPAGNDAEQKVRLTIDYDKITNLFFEDENARKRGLLAKAAQPSGQPKDDAIHVLDAKRRQNLEICLKGQGLLDDMSGLISTVVDLVGIDGSGTDPYLVSQETLEIVLTLLPTAEEERALLQHLQKAETTQFARAEQFLIRLMSIPLFKQRTSACTFAMSCKKEVGVLEERVKRFETNLERLLMTLEPGGALHAVLALILRLGNYLNAGTRRGSARGFTLDSLSQLKGLRSYDGSTTLLRVAADAIETQRPSCWEELRGALSAHAAAQSSEYSLDDLSTVLVKLRQRATAVADTAKELERIGESRPARVFSDLIKEMDIKLTALEKRLSCIEKNLQKLILLFGEKGRTPADASTVLAKLGQFWKELFAARQENQERLAREAKKAKKRIVPTVPGSSPQSMRKVSAPSSPVEQPPVPLSNELLTKIKQMSEEQVKLNPPINKTNSRTGSNNRPLRRMIPSSPQSAITLSPGLEETEPGSILYKSLSYGNRPTTRDGARSSPILPLPPPAAAAQMINSPVVEGSQSEQPASPKGHSRKTLHNNTTGILAFPQRGGPDLGRMLAHRDSRADVSPHPIRTKRDIIIGSPPGGAVRRNRTPSPEGSSQPVVVSRGIVPILRHPPHRVITPTVPTLPLERQAVWEASCLPTMSSRSLDIWGPASSSNPSRQRLEDTHYHGAEPCCSISTALNSTMPAGGRGNRTKTIRRMFKQLTRFCREK